MTHILSIKKYEKVQAVHSLISHPSAASWRLSVGGALTVLQRNLFSERLLFGSHFANLSSGMCKQNYLYCMFVMAHEPRTRMCRIWGSVRILDFVGKLMVTELRQKRSGGNHSEGSCLQSDSPGLVYVWLPGDF